MCQIAIDIPEEVMYDTKMNKSQASAFARAAVALGYYTQSGVSIGYCAQIEGMSEEDFIKYLGANGVSIFKYESIDDLRAEVQDAY